MRRDRQILNNVNRFDCLRPPPAGTDATMREDGKVSGASFALCVRFRKPWCAKFRSPAEPGKVTVMSSVVQITGLRKQYNGREVVRGIDLHVPAGRCFGLLGQNGAGKTTTLRLLLGQSPVSEGNGFQ